MAALAAAGVAGLLRRLRVLAAASAARPKRPRTRLAAYTLVIEEEPKVIGEPHRSFWFAQLPPESRRPEFALFGRSNVGKSSFINYLCNRKLLSTISKRPGHTKLIHHFCIDRSWYLVDLPGIGFARKGDTKKDLNRMITEYVKKRESLCRIFYLVDATLPPKDIDLNSIRWLVEEGKEVTIILTKSDKEVQELVRRTMHRDGPAAGLEAALLRLKDSPWNPAPPRPGSEEGPRRPLPLPPMFLTSSRFKVGRDQVLEHIAVLRRRHQASIDRRADTPGKIRAAFMRKASAAGPPPRGTR